MKNHQHVNAGHTNVPINGPSDTWLEDIKRKLLEVLVSDTKTYWSHKQDRQCDALAETRQRLTDMQKDGQDVQWLLNLLDACTSETL